MRNHRIFTTACSATFFLLSWGALPSRAEEDPHAGHHAHHAMPAVAAHYTQTSHPYNIPDVVLVNQDGKEVPLQDLLADGRPVMLNIIFTTCTAICPVMTSTVVKTRQSLGNEASDLTLVSITNDPDHDTPAVLKSYAARHGAAGGWQFLTGNRAQITRVLRAFEAYPGNKMNHLPLTFLKPAHGAAWIRIEGLTTASELAGEYRKLASMKAAP